MWSNSTRNAVFAAVLIEYLSNGTLLSITQVSDILGSKECIFLLFSRAVTESINSQTGME